MAKIGPYPRARRASRLWYNTVIFAFCSGRKGRKRPAGRSLIKLRPAFAYPAPTIADQNFLQITLIIPGQQTRRGSSRFTSPIQVVLPLLIRLTIRETKPNNQTRLIHNCAVRAIPADFAFPPDPNGSAADSVRRLND